MTTSTGGRGCGFDPTEFAAFDVPIEEIAGHFHEVVAIVPAAGRNERLTLHGKYWDFDDVEVLPKPAQQPHPPI